MENREDKQEGIYQYVTSENLSFEKILEVHTKLPDIQAKEPINPCGATESSWTMT